MKNEKFSLHLKKYFYVYIVAFLVIASLFPVAINLRTKLNQSEKFQFFISISNVKKTNLKNDLDSKLNGRIKEYVIDAVNVSSSSYYQVFEARGLSADLIIYSEDQLKNMDDLRASYYLEIPEKYQKENDYIRNGSHFALQMNGGSVSYLTKYITYPEGNYYLCIGKNSSHLLGLTSDSKTDIISILLDSFIYEK